MRKYLDFNSYNRLRKMSFNDLNRWVTAFYKNAFVDGMDKAEDGIVTISENDFRDLLKSVHGVGEKRADEIIEKLKTFEAGRGKGGEE